jgi:alpha-glucosidase
MSFSQTLKSPNDKFVLEVGSDSGQLRYRLLGNGTQILKWSRLGLTIKSTRSIGEGLKLIDSSLKSVDETEELLWGQNRYLHTNYNELALTLREASPPNRTVIVRFRLFNDGLAFRYELPEQDGLESVDIAEEVTQFNMPSDVRAWWIPSHQPDRYEYLYTKSIISDIPLSHTPLTLQYSNGLHVAIHEAALYKYGSMNLRPSSRGGLRTEITPLSTGIVGSVDLPATLPWRTVTIADSAAGLIDSSITLSLNDPPLEGQDFSWVKPIKFMGIWWGMFTGVYTWERGDRHGATTENAIKYIDACKDLGIDALLIEGWNVGWDGNWMENGSMMRFTEPADDFDIEAVAAYAKEKGVELVGHHETSGDTKNYESQMEDAFAFYRRLGVKYVKTGYVGTRLDKAEYHHSQYGVEHYQKSIETAARYGIMLNIHEPIKGTGIERTWPNVLTREGAKGQEHEGGGLNPAHATILPFTRLLAGPMDYTPGIFDINNYSKRVASTLARQLALYVVVYSPMQMVADLPENYKNNPAFKFIRDVPVDWSETIALEGAIGEYVVIARKDRNSEDWYVGGLTNEQARELTLDLKFLDDQVNYRAEIYKDGVNAHWRDNQKDITIEHEELESSDAIQLRIAHGGGFAIRFTPVKITE